jgi:hypothetical protein
LLFNSFDFIFDNRGFEKDYLWKMLDQFHHQFTHQLLGENRPSVFWIFRKILARFRIRKYKGAINYNYNSFHGILIVFLVKHNFLRGFLHIQVIFEIQPNSSSFQILAEDS